MNMKKAAIAAAQAAQAALDDKIITGLVMDNGTPVPTKLSRSTAAES